MLILVVKKTCICSWVGGSTLLGGDPSWKQRTFSLPKGLPQWRNSNIFPKIFVVNTTDSQSESEASPVKRPRLLDDSNDRPEETSRSKQKSRRRCFQCQTKLELVQQELGSCRCGEYCLSAASGFWMQPCSDLCHIQKNREHLSFSPCKDALAWLPLVAKSYN